LDEVKVVLTKVLGQHRLLNVFTEDPNFKFKLKLVVSSQNLQEPVHHYLLQKIKQALVLVELNLKY
jgi:hypothetical protein